MSTPLGGTHRSFYAPHSAVLESPARGVLCFTSQNGTSRRGYWLQLPHSVFWETIKGIRRGNAVTDVFLLSEFINQDCSVTPSCQPYWSMTFTSVAESILFAPPASLFKSVWPLDRVDRKSPEFKLTWLEGLQLQLKSEKTNKRRKEMLQYAAGENEKYKVTSYMTNIRWSRTAFRLTERSGRGSPVVLYQLS